MLAEPLQGKSQTESGVDWSEFLRPAWLARRREEALEPDIPIIDPHHHIWDVLGYGLSEFLVDLGGGHNVRKTVHLESGLGRNPADPVHLQPVGETRYLLDLIDDDRLKQPGAPDVCAGIIGDAKLDLPGELLDEVLHAHVAAGQGRFKGVRFNGFWHPEIGWRDDTWPGMMEDAAIRSGLSALARHGLVCDVIVFHDQLHDLARLAAALPDLTFIVNHCGGFLGRTAKHEGFDAAYAVWLDGIAAIASEGNVRMKLGGLFNDTYSGVQLHLAENPPSSAEVAEAARPFFDPCIERFGAGRCMFESNYPADRQQVDYTVLWNAFKRISAGASADEKASLFSETARQAYSL